jgi:hypothetical protein
LRALGVDVGERALAAEADTTTSGTLNWLLARAIRARGVDVRFTEPASIDDVRAPAIVGVGVGTLGHFVAYLGTQPPASTADARGDLVIGDLVIGDLVIGEPLKGRVVMTRAAFDARYRFDRFALELTRPGAPVAGAAAAAVGSD